MKVFLTGGTGFIGQPLTQALLKQGWEVIALVRNPESVQSRALQTMGATLATGDITDKASMLEAMSDADLVFHNAGHYEVGVNADGRKRMTAINELGTENVLSLALELKIPKTVYVSSAIVHGDTGDEIRDENFQRTTPFNSFYEQSKTKAHEIANKYKDQGLPLVTVCPNGVIGPKDHSPYGYFLRLYLNKLMPPMAWSPNDKMGLVHVDDLVAGMVLAADKGKVGETYILSGEAIDRRYMLQLWAQFPGSSKRHLWIPKPLAYWLFWAMEPLLRMLGLPAFISRETVSSSYTLNYSNAKARHELGWSHRTAKQAWADIITREMELLEAKKNQSLLSRLKPSEE
jgi:nucleoside-diphosphate-sugar epimerase